MKLRKTRIKKETKANGAVEYTPEYKYWFWWCDFYEFYADNEVRDIYGEWAKMNRNMKGYKHAQTFIVHCGYTDNVVFDDRSCVIFKKDDHKFTILVKQIAEARYDVLARSFMEGVSDCILSHKKYKVDANDKHS